MHMICPSMPIPASTELTEFLYISCRVCLGLMVRGPPAWQGLHSAGAVGTPLAYSKNSTFDLLTNT